MGTLAVDPLLAGFEEPPQLCTRGTAGKFEHDAEAAHRGGIVHGPQIRHETFFINAPRGDAFLPGLEHHLGAAAVERLVEGIQQGLLQGGDADLGTRAVAPLLDPGNQPGRAAGAVERDSLETKEELPETTRPAAPGGRRPRWPFGDVFLRASALRPGALGTQLGDMVVLDELRRQCVKRHGTEVADDPRRLARHQEFEGVHFRFGTCAYLDEIDGFAFDGKRRGEAQAAEPFQQRGVRTGRIPLSPRAGFIANLPEDPVEGRLGPAADRGPFRRGGSKSLRFRRARNASR